MPKRIDPLTPEQRAKFKAMAAERFDSWYETLLQSEDFTEDYYREGNHRIAKLAWYGVASDMGRLWHGMSAQDRRQGKHLMGFMDDAWM